MDEQEKSKFKKLYEEMPEGELIEMLSADKSVYQPGCYELLRDEMIRRGIEDKVQSRIKKKENDERMKINIVKPSIYSILSVSVVLLWPLGAVLGIGMLLGGAAMAGPVFGLGTVLFMVLGLKASIVIPTIGFVLACIGLLKSSKDYFAYLGLILNLAIMIRISGA